MCKIRKTAMMNEREIKALNLGSDNADITSLLHSQSWHLFREEVRTSRRYAEWGAGLSTLYAASQPHCETVMAVETDPVWVEKILSAQQPGNATIRVIFVDFGEVSKWGRPIDYSKIGSIEEYSNAPFSDGFNPDLILIDGRFRVHCFLEALLKAERGTRIVFDDYVNRPHYKIVEKFLKPEKVSGRQALFIVRTWFFQRLSIRRMSKLFSHVMD